MKKMIMPIGLTAFTILMVRRLISTWNSDYETQRYMMLVAKDDPVQVLNGIHIHESGLKVGRSEAFATASTVAIILSLLNVLIKRKP